LLLDTHAWLWWVSNDPRLPDNLRTLLLDKQTQVHVSAVTAIEIATKYRLGKLDEAADAVHRYDELIRTDGFHHLPINYAHSLTAGSYPSEHRDPFDRLLAAQVQLESLHLVTRDSAFAQLGIATLWR
jgi:PIN domain nuclease of toxin-antitoxin system